MAGHYFNTVENVVTGKPVSGATITVYNAGATIAGDAVTAGTIATIFSDDGITSVPTGKVTSDSRGFYEFWTNESSVVIEISYGGVARKAISDVEIVGGDVNSDITQLQNRVSAVEIVTQDPTVVAFYGLTGAADKVPYFSGVDAMALADFTAAGRALVGGVDAAAQRVTLGAAASGPATSSGLTMATARLLGRYNASTGAIEEISLASNLSLVGGVLSLAPAIQSVTSAATVTPAFGDDLVKITAQAEALTLANWSGTAIPGWGMAIRIKDNGTARAISYGTNYRAIGVTLPTTTAIGKTLYLACIWNNDDGKIDVVAVAQET